MTISECANKGPEKQKTLYPFGPALDCDACFRLFQSSRNFPVNRRVYFCMWIILLGNFAKLVFKIKKSWPNHADFSEMHATVRLKRLQTLTKYRKIS